MNTIFPEKNPALTDGAASNPEQVSHEAADILAYLLRMEKQIEDLERAVYASNRVKTVPAGVRREGADYYARGKVHHAAKETGKDGDVYSGSVLCSFGFVHHPWVKVSHHADGVQIGGYRCDCQQFSDGEFCAHCAALIAGDYPTELVTLLPGSARSAASEVSNMQAGIKSISVVGRSDLENGCRIYRGKALCNFNFVHRPELTVDASGLIKSYACTCSAQDGKMCSHCNALRPLVQADFEREAEPEADPEPEEGLRETPADILAEEAAWLMEEEQLPDFSLIAGAENETVEEAEEPAAEEESAEEVPEEPEEAAAEEPEEEPVDGTTMTIRFGTEVETEEPVLWYPNDTNQITHINMGIIGTMGTGKTQFTKSVITQLHRQNKCNPGKEDLGILIFDYKGDYNEEKTDFIAAAGARVLKLHRLPFNPFALNDFKRKPQLHVHTAMTFADTLTRIYGLGPIQKTTLVQAILAAYEGNGINADPGSWSRPSPTFAQVYEQYSKGRSPRGDSLTAAMDTIAMFELFEPDPLRTVSLYEMLHGTVVIDMSGYPNDLKNLAVAIILDLFYAQMLNSSHSRLVTTPEGEVYRQIKKVILVDEADNIMSSGLPVLRNIIKEGREFGVGMVLSTQFLDHFRADDEDYRKYMKTWVVHNVENLKKSDVEYVFQLPGNDPRTEKVFQDIKQLEKHHSLVRIGTGLPRYVRDLPFFKIADDVQASYLPALAEEEPEETE